MPVGGILGQRLKKIVRKSKKEFHEEDLIECSFAPLYGEKGFRE